MIKAENLTKRYGAGIALDSVSFEIGERGVIGLLGPNGAGKSTTMNIITGYLSASSGTVTVMDTDIMKNPTKAKSYIGYLPEQPPLYPEMTVEEYLSFVYDLKKCRLDRKAHLGEICDVVGISDVKGRIISHLSKGYRQRVGIAQALINDPPILIFDEPTVGLDPKQIIEIRNLIRTLGAKHTVILSTHILSEVQAVCERIIIINKGKIIADRMTDELSREIDDTAKYKIKVCAQKDEAQREFSACPALSGCEPLPDRDGDSVTFILENKKGVDARKSIYYICAKAGWAIIEFSPIGFELEDIFMRLVDGKESKSNASSGDRRKRSRRDERRYTK